MTKRTFYRRAWVHSTTHDEVYSGYDYHPTKEKWDELHDYGDAYRKGPWEEIEIDEEK